MDYETGLLFAFLTWIYGLASVLVHVNGQMNRNFNKVGMRLSWLNFRPKAMTRDDQIRPLWRSVLKFLLIAGIGIPFIFLSWVQVALYVGTQIYRWSKDSGAPEAIKEYRWRLRNTDMTMDQMIQEMMKVEKQDPAKFDEFKTEIVNDMKSRGLTIW